MEKICLTEKELLEAINPHYCYGDLSNNPTLDRIKQQALRLNAIKKCEEDKDLESLIAIGEACIKSGLQGDYVLWCTSKHSITVKSLLDLKKYHSEI